MRYFYKLKSGRLTEITKDDYIDYLKLSSLGIFNIYQVLDDQYGLIMVVERNV